MTIRPRRSVLFLPASNQRAIDKARTLASDVLILDLEDAVAPEAKAAARGAAVAAMATGFGARERVVRANGLDTEWGAADAAALASANVEAVVFPKISSPADLAAARAALGEEGPPIWAMIETCAAILDLRGLAAAAAATGTTAFIAGTNDLAKEMRCRPDTTRAPLVPALMQIVVAARAAGIVALDGVCNAIGDEARLAAECDQGRMLGFDGKTLIHPSQIAAANAAFAPSEAEVAWANRVVAAFADPAAAARGAIQVDGAMVERLHLEEAEAILARAT